MKKQLFFYAVMFWSAIAFAQVPQGINYQGIARNAAGTLLPGQVISLRISVLSGAGGTVLYSETHSTTTNQFGLFTVKIGMGSPVTGTFAGINWAAGNQYARIEIDPAGGSSYINLGDSQLLSVPFALFAESGGSPPPASWRVNGNTGLLSTDFFGTTDLTDIIFKNNNTERMRLTTGGRLGIGVVAPLSTLHVAGGKLRVEDTDPQIDLYSGAAHVASLHTSGSNFHVENMQVGNILFNVTGSEKVRITSAGTMGFNNTSPSAIIDINHNGASNVNTGIEYNNMTSAGINDVISVALTNDATTSGEKHGVLNYVYDNGSGRKFGITNYVYQAAASSADCYGIYNYTRPGSTTGTVIQAGIYNTVSAANNYSVSCYGLRNNVEVPSTHTSSIYGVFSGLSNNGTSGIHIGVYSNPGIGGSTQWAYYGLGDSFLSGGTWQASDERLKNHITPVNSALDKIKLLEPKYYEFKQDVSGMPGLPKGGQFGFLASELEKVFPEMVRGVEQPVFEEKDGKVIEKEPYKFKAVNYTFLIPVLTEAIREQQKIIDEQEKRISKLEGALKK